MLIWDNLPSDIQDNIYSKIIFPQNKNLLEDIRNYRFVKTCLLNSFPFRIEFSSTLQT